MLTGTPLSPNLNKSQTDPIFSFSVATVMFSTTVLIAVQMKFVKHWHALIAVGFFLVFGFLDGLFWGAALKKVPHGAWVPLVIGSILYVRSHDPKDWH